MNCMSKRLRIIKCDTLKEKGADIMENTNDSVMKPYYAEYFKKKHPQLFEQAEVAKGNKVLNELSNLLAETCEKNLGIDKFK